MTTRNQCIPQPRVGPRNHVERRQFDLLFKCLAIVSVSVVLASLPGLRSCTTHEGSVNRLQEGRRLRRQKRLLLTMEPPLEEAPAMILH
ncbi:hypothetical protein JOB18_024749 [Solea senegalensis]|uniref:Uncharacterized protein n=1 Tax=Solea senegalensis TaxID=28829 RepID=A0AAV6S4B6_SOLSE|nr:hypothetical protein JOB18_024749 [Solea senegalensis]